MIYLFVCLLRTIKETPTPSVNTLGDQRLILESPSHLFCCLEPKEETAYLVRAALQADMLILFAMDEEITPLLSSIMSVSSCHGEVY